MLFRSPSVILMKGIQFFIHSLLPKRVNMGLTIGVRFIEGGKSKIVVIISKIRGRNAYGVERRSSGPT